MEETLKFPQLNHSTSQEILLSSQWEKRQQRISSFLNFITQLSKHPLLSLAERFFFDRALSRFYSFSILAKGPDLFDWGLLSKPGRFWCSWYGRSLNFSQNIFFFFQVLWKFQLNPTDFEIFIFFIGSSKSKIIFSMQREKETL